MSKMPEMTNEVKEQLKQYHGDEPVSCGCGGTPIVFQTNAGDYWYVQCSHCYITTRGVLTRAGAVLVWNQAMGGSE
jgi:hypothetical protein